MKVALAQEFHIANAHFREETRGRGLNRRAGEDQAVTPTKYE
jgi:hypothetical protein